MYGTAFDADRRGAAWLARNWWAVALRGVAAVVFGILALLMPAMTLKALVLLFGAYAIVEGIFSLISAARGQAPPAPRWVLILEGVVSIAAGLAAFLWPGLTALVLLYVIAAWALVIGVLQIVAAVRLHNQIRGEWWLVLSGVLSVVVGVLMMWRPGAGALALVLWIGWYTIFFGALLIVLAFRLRGGRAEAAERLSRAA